LTEYILDSSQRLDALLATYKVGESGIPEGGESGIPEGGESGIPEAGFREFLGEYQLSFVLFLMVSSLEV